MIAPMEPQHYPPGDGTFEMNLCQLIREARTTDIDLSGTYSVPALGSTTPAYTVTIAPGITDPPADEPRLKRSYCCECEWTASTAEYTIQELSARAVEHAVETGHDIDSEDCIEQLEPRQQ